jgi:hypothetical protein
MPLFSRKKKIKIVPFQGYTFTGKIDHEKKLKKGFEIIWDPDGYRYDWSGNGILTYDDETTYEGQIKKGKYNGKGKRIYPSKEGDDFVSYYDGDWIDGVQHGQGTYLHPSGWKYEGSWINGVMSGFGKFYFHDGTIYKGQVKNNNMNGDGKYYRLLTFVSGKRKLSIKKINIYIGQWIDGEFNGQGTYYHENDKPWYIGNWRKGVCHGTGVTFNKDGSVLEHGEYCEGSLVEYVEYGDERTRMRHRLSITHNIPVLDLSACIDDDNSDTVERIERIQMINTPKPKKAVLIKHIPSIEKIKGAKKSTPRTPRMIKSLANSNLKIPSQPSEKPIKTVDKSNSKEVKTHVKTIAPVASKASKWRWISSLFSRKKKDKVKTVTVGNPVRFSSVVAKNVKKIKKNIVATNKKDRKTKKVKAAPKLNPDSREIMNVAFGLTTERKSRENVYRVSTSRSNSSRNTNRVSTPRPHTPRNTTRVSEKQGNPKPNTPRFNKKKPRGNISMLNPLEVTNNPSNIQYSRIKEWDSNGIVNRRRRRVSLARSNDSSKPPKAPFSAPVKQIKMQAKTFDSLELLKLVNRSNREIRRHSLESKKEIRKTNPLITASRIALKA